MTKPHKERFAAFAALVGFWAAVAALIWRAFQ